jgi:signal transduction histidine kinase
MLSAVSWRGWADDLWRNAGLVALVAAVEVLVTHAAGTNQPDRRPLDALGVGLIVLAAAPLLVRRQMPVVVLALTTVITLLYWLLGYPRGPVFLAPIVAVFSAILGGKNLAAWLTLAIGFVAFAWLPTLLGLEPLPMAAAMFGIAGWMVLIGVAAELVRVQQERSRAARRTRVEEERVRLAQELHDVLAHGITVINVQAAVGLHLLEERPEQARAALTAIKEVSKDALDDLRSVVARLRNDGEEPLRRPSPSPSLAHLDALVATATAGGLQIRTEVSGRVDDLPPLVDLAAFRILQEALTNVIRHATSKTATIRLTHDEHELMLEVDDDGQGTMAGASSAGRGIQGMRERAQTLGGQMEVGPRPEGGFRVMARLPLDGAV